ncbi:MAG: arginase [Alphaproteobacteria bacterium]|nr:arginase [Alphaproteobacteria bacterium]
MAADHSSAPRHVTLIGAPTDIGAGDRGASMGPEALRVARLERALRRLGVEVEDIGDLKGPANPEAPPVEGYRHLDETIAWCTAVRDAVHAALSAGSCPILMGGDHCLAIGSLAALSRAMAEQDRPFAVLWFDAHSDFNTPESSPSGNIHGMPVAVICGYGHERLLGIADATPMVDPRRIVQVGIRSVDAIEKRMVVESGLVVYDMRQIDEARMRTIMLRALEHVGRDGGHLHVSLDVDFLDPTIAPGVGTTVPGGPNYREAQLCMEMVYDSGLMGSLDIMELNPALDHGNRTAELVVELVESLFGEQTLARTHDNPRYHL